MSEQVVFTSRAVVFYYDSAKKSWAPSPVTGYSRLDIYKNTATGGYRLIGRGIEDPTSFSINSTITKDTAYGRAKDTFHQFQDARYLYGLNFGAPSEADPFGTEFEKAVNTQKGAVQPAKPPAAPAAPQPPTPPVGKPGPPPPPKAPPKPPPPRVHAASSSSSEEGADPNRNALLDSIQGFAKNKLKKAETVDKSEPQLIPTKPSADGSETGGAAKASPNSRSSPGGGGGGAGDMMASIMAKRAAMQQKSMTPVTPTPLSPTGSDKKPAPPIPKNHAPAILRTESSTANKPPAKPPRDNSRLSPRDSITIASPPIADPSPSTPDNNNGQPALPEHLQTLKDEILAEVRLELAQLKNEILNAIRSR